MNPDVTLRIDNDVLLRPLTLADITERYVDGLNRDEVKHFLMGPNAQPQTHETVSDFVQQNLHDPAGVLFGIFAGGAHCGNVRLHDIAAASAWIGIAVFDPTRWGYGLGSRAIRQVADYAIDGLGLNKVNAGIETANERSRGAFARAGFRQVELDPAMGRRMDGELWVYP